MAESIHGPLSLWELSGAYRHPDNQLEPTSYPFILSVLTVCGKSQVVDEPSLVILVIKPKTARLQALDTFLEFLSGSF